MSGTLEELQKVIEPFEKIIAAQSVIIKRSQDNIYESIGLAGVRLGTIAALRRQIAHLEELLAEKEEEA